jgi:hypothetical protein
VGPRCILQTKSWKRPGYTILEGSASWGDQDAEFFLVVGQAHVSLDIQSRRSLSDHFLTLLEPILGPPQTGPAVVNVGELMDSLDEAPVNATWSFPPVRGEEILQALERLLQADRNTAVGASE